MTLLAPSFSRWIFAWARLGKHHGDHELIFVPGRMQLSNKLLCYSSVLAFMIVPLYQNLEREGEAVRA